VHAPGFCAGVFHGSADALMGVVDGQRPPLVPLLPEEPLEPLEPLLPEELPEEPLEPLLPEEPLEPDEPLEPLLPEEPLEPLIPPSGRPEPTAVPEHAELAPSTTAPLKNVIAARSKYFMEMAFPNGSPH
jgi:hypothetical protein